jgi:hypothetical protein
MVPAVHARSACRWIGPAPQRNIAISMPAIAAWVRSQGSLRYMKNEPARFNIRKLGMTRHYGIECVTPDDPP